MTINVTLNIKEVKNHNDKSDSRLFQAWISGDCQARDMFPLAAAINTSKQVIRYKNAIEDKVWRWSTWDVKINFTYNPTFL